MYMYKSLHCLKPSSSHHVGLLLVVVLCSCPQGNALKQVGWNLPAGCNPSGLAVKPQPVNHESPVATPGPDTLLLRAKVTLAVLSITTAAACCSLAISSAQPSFEICTGYAVSSCQTRFIVR